MGDVCDDNSSQQLQLVEDASDEQNQPSATPVFCQVHNCGVLLTGGKTYCIKKRACTEHMTAESVLLEEDGLRHRFCQQCGKFEPISKFDSTKRSCRARLAKRRSGTRALLQKKGCRDSSTSAAAAAAAAATDQGANSGCDHSMMAASAGMAPHGGCDIGTAGYGGGAGFTDDELLMLFGGQDHSSDKLFRLLSEQPVSLAAAAASPQPGDDAAHISPLRHGVVRSLSDSPPDAATSAATAAAAATSAAAGAAHHAISAPLFTMGAYGSGRHQQYYQQSAAAAAADAAAAATADQMCQAEVLIALQAMDEPSDSLLRLHGSNTSGGMSTAGGQADQHTSCSLPLANLDLSQQPRSVHFQLQAPGSPTSSIAGGACKSAPLVGLGGAAGAGSLLQGHGPVQRARSSVTAAAMQQLQQQQQAGMPRAGSRLKWLIQELQQELDVCGAAQLEDLNNDELGTLLCAALAPPGASSAGAAVTAAPPAPAASAAPLFGMSSLPAAGGSGSSAAMQTNAELQYHKLQVQQLQQKVQQLQLQLHLRKDLEGGNAAMKCATPPLAPADHTMSAAAELDSMYRSASNIPAAHTWAGTGAGAGGSLLHHASLSSAGTMLPPHLQSSGSMAAALTAGGVPAGGNACAMLTAGVSAAGWGPGSAANMLGMLKQQQLQLQQQQQASAPMSANTAAAQFMALQSQLQMVESEMMTLLGRQQQAGAAVTMS